MSAYHGLARDFVLLLLFSFQTRNSNFMFSDTRLHQFQSKHISFPIFFSPMTDDDFRNNQKFERVNLLKIPEMQTNRK